MARSNARVNVYREIGNFVDYFCDQYRSVRVFAAVLWLCAQNLHIGKVMRTRFMLEYT